MFLVLEGIEAIKGYLLSSCLMSQNFSIQLDSQSPVTFFAVTSLSCVGLVSVSNYV